MFIWYQEQGVLVLGPATAVLSYTSAYGATWVEKFQIWLHRSLNCLNVQSKFVLICELYVHRCR